MAGIIGVSGSQGQGKSTTIKAALEVDSNLNYLDIQTARELLIDWDYSLSEINAYMPLKVKFQEELFNRHASKLHETAMTQTGIYLVERTFADIFNYALTSVGPFNEYSDWLSTYAEKCSAAQKLYFNHVVLLSGREYVPEDDGVRSTNNHFSRLTDHLINDYTKQFTWDGVTDDQVTFVTTPDLTERVELLVEVSNAVERIRQTQN